MAKFKYGLACLLLLPAMHVVAEEHQEACQQTATRLKQAIDSGNLKVLQKPRMTEKTAMPGQNQARSLFNEAEMRQMPDDTIPAMPEQGARVSLEKGPDGIQRTYYLNCATGMLYLSKRAAAADITYWLGPYKIKDVVPQNHWWMDAGR